MGKNAQRRREATQDNPAKHPQADHFILNTDAYIAIRRYLGSRPHDETRQLIGALEQLPVVTTDDVAKREAASARLAELEEIVEGHERDPAPELTPDEETELDEIVNEAIDETLTEMAGDVENPEQEGA